MAADRAARGSERSERATRRRMAERGAPRGATREAACERDARAADGGSVPEAGDDDRRPPSDATPATYHVRTNPVLLDAALARLRERPEVVGHRVGGGGTWIRVVAEFADETAATDAMAEYGRLPGVTDVRRRE